MEKIQSTSYALKDGIHVFIDDIIIAGQNGAKGYYCHGCSGPMRAVKNKKGYQNYFAHISKRGADNSCTYSNETYRHNLAKSILCQSKQIKLPTVWKFSPDFSEKVPIRKFRKGEERKYLGLKVNDGTIHASFARPELYFFIKAGRIKFQKEHPGPQDSLIKADVVFFNEKGHPVLLIEVCATHKVDPEKILKLNRIGIDTIEIKIHPDTPENIEKRIKYESKHTKWLYNSEEKGSRWVDCARRLSSRIQRSDKEDSNLSGIKLCDWEIKSLCKSLSVFMADSEFIRAKTDIEGKISAVESASERIRSILQNAHRKEAEELENCLRESVNGRRLLIQSRIHDDEKEISAEFRKRLKVEIARISEDHAREIKVEIARISEDHAREMDEIASRRASLEERRAGLGVLRASLEERRAGLGVRRASLEERRAGLGVRRASLEERRAEIKERRRICSIDINGIDRELQQRTKKLKSGLGDFYRAQLRLIKEYNEENKDTPIKSRKDIEAYITGIFPDGYPDTIWHNKN